MGKHKWEKDIFSFIHLDRRRLRKRKERKENRKIGRCKRYRDELKLLQRKNYKITSLFYIHIILLNLLTKVGASTYNVL